MQDNTRTRTRSHMAENENGTLLPPPAMILAMGKDYPLDLESARGQRIPVAMRDRTGKWYWMGLRKVTSNNQVAVGSLAVPELRELHFTDGISRWLWVVDDSVLVAGKFRLPCRLESLADIRTLGLDATLTPEKIARRLGWRSIGAASAAAALKAWIMAESCRSEKAPALLAKLKEVTEYIEPADYKAPPDRLAILEEKVESMALQLSKLEALLEALI